MNRKYKIVASPSFMTVKTGDTVVYRLAPRNPLQADYSFDWEPTWFQLNQTETARPGSKFIVRGPTADSWAVKYDDPGKYAIACTAWRTKPDPSWSKADLIDTNMPAAWDSWEVCFYPQCVEGEEAFLFDPVLGKNTHALDPYAALSGIKRYRSVLYQVGKEQFPNPQTVSGTEMYQEHQELLETLGVEIEALGKRLASTSGNNSDFGDRWERHPIMATHHLDDPQSPVPDSELKLFLAKRIRVMAKMFNDPDKDEIEWKLVDWTNPVDRGRTGEYEGAGKTDYEAVREALRRWSNYYPLRIGNRYPKGSVSYIVPAGVCSKDEIRETFQTNGSTWWDDVDEFLGWVGLLSLVVLGIITLIAPVPGSQLASFAIWAGIAGAIAGTAQSAIHLAEQYQDDFNRDWKEEAIDVLTIVGCIAGLGTSWARGAAVKGLTSLKAAKGIFYGSVGVDLLTGIIVADNYAEEMERIKKDNTISPDKKIKKLMLLFAQLAGQSALLFVNVRANSKELAHFNAPQPPPPAGKPQLPAGKTEPPPAGKPDLPPAERLKKYADPKQEIDVSQAPKLVGNTKDGQHTTIIRDDPYRPAVIPVPPPPPPPPPPPRKLAEALQDKKAWWTKEISPTRINLDRRIPGMERQRATKPLLFDASFEHGDVHVGIIRTAGSTTKRSNLRAPDFRADELYPWMFEHFETTAKSTKSPVKSISGEFAFDNLRGVEEALLKDPKAAEISKQNPTFSQEKVLEAMPQASVEKALEGAPSWKYWKQYAEKYGYTMKANTVAVRPDGYGGLVRHVEWSFILGKKP